MKIVRFSQSLNVSVTVDAQVPDSWSVEDIESYIDEYSITITADEYATDNEAMTVSLVVNGVDIGETIIWEGTQ